MYRKIALSILITLIISAGCTGSNTQYSEVKNFIKDYTVALTDYRNEIKNAENAKEVTSAIHRLTLKISRFAKQKKQIEKKYPALPFPGNGLNSIPEELKTDFSNFQKNQGDTKAATKQMMYTYMSNKRVVNAMLELNKKLSAFN